MVAGPTASPSETIFFTAVTPRRMLSLPTVTIPVFRKIFFRQEIQDGGKSKLIFLRILLFFSWTRNPDGRLEVNICFLINRWIISLLVGLLTKYLPKLDLNPWWFVTVDRPSFSNCWQLMVSSIAWSFLCEMVHMVSSDMGEKPAWLDCWNEAAKITIDFFYFENSTAGQLIIVRMRTRPQGDSGWGKQRSQKQLFFSSQLHRLRPWQGSCLLDILSGIVHRTCFQHSDGNSPVPLAE